LTSTTNATVTFGKFQSYNVLFQAPFKGSASDSLTMRSYSANINKVGKDGKIPTTTVTVQDVLYSLNNGKTNDVETTDSKNITNVFAAPTTLNKTLAYYLRNNVVKKEGSPNISGADSLKETLEETVGKKIATIFPSVVEAKKNDLKDDPKTVTDPLSKKMSEEQKDATAVKVTGALKSSILEKVPVYGDQLKEGTLKEKSFQVMAKVTTILSKATETELDLIKDYPALADKLAGKSAETQLTNFATDFLSKIKVDPKYDYGKLKPDFVVTKPTGNTPNFTISASVTAEGNEWPTLDKSVTMTSYADSFNIWVVAQITSVAFDANGDGKFENENIPNLPAAVTAPDLYSSAQLGVKTDVTDVLKAVDTEVGNTWEDAFGENGVAIDMGKVLSKKLLDQVVEGIIEKPSNTLTTKVASLGDGVNTSNAFMNLYRDFVVFGSDNASLLNLKTAGDELTPIGSVNNDGSLALKIDFEKILRDASAGDKTSYEQLVNLIVGLRDGISTDIRVTSEGANSKQSAQSVIANLILGRLNTAGVSIEANKWGEPVDAKSMSYTQQKELANLVAGLLMNSAMNSDFDSDVWTKFEDNGYQSVKFEFKLDSNKRGGLKAFIDSYYGSGNKTGTTLDIGFQITQNIE
jgi:hypothetical protein